jgi:hypothetical protein
MFIDQLASSENLVVGDVRKNTRLGRGIQSNPPGQGRKS